VVASIRYADVDINGANRFAPLAAFRLVRAPTTSSYDAPSDSQTSTWWTVANARAIPVAASRDAQEMDGAVNATPTSQRLLLNAITTSSHRGERLAVPVVEVMTIVVLLQ
jgi:hypothetical protein